jgi:tryptophan synthase alpha chain
MVLASKLDNNRISRSFHDLKQKREAALICYIVAGFPDLKTSEKIIETLVRAGADIIEIGIPFSDPIADGQSIQEASHHALIHGVTPQQCVTLARTTRKKFPELPLLIMTYSNILFRTGLEAFMSKARVAGVDGFILPDMSIEESKEYLRISHELGLASVFIVSPNTERKRAYRIINASTGFLYVISLYGVTGVRNTLDDHSIRKINAVRKFAKPSLPIAVGFGIQNQAHVSMMVSAGADGVIVGSALVNIIRRKSGHNLEMLDDLYDFVRQMKKACSR